MCTQVHLVLPSGTDIAAIDVRVERLKVGHELVAPGKEAPRLVEGERAYLLTPWKMCHCGWSPRDFEPVIRETLESRDASWMGVLVSEHGTPHGGDRARIALAELGSVELGEDTLYIVEASPRPPIARRHGPRRRRSRT